MKKDAILEGMETYFESKQPGKDMKDILQIHSAGSAKAARCKWEKENPAEKTRAQLLAGERA